ncbi:MAG: hypothetical protein AAFQ99_12935, partial [Pseudomonadota bacterium]
MVSALTPLLLGKEMFTNSTIALSELSNEFGIEVLRDCYFAFVGKVPTRLDQRLVPASTKQHIFDAVAASGVAGVVTTAELAGDVPQSMGVAISQAPLRSALAIQEHIAQLPDFQWKSFESRVHPSAVIYEGAYVAPHDVEIGEGTIVFPNAVILPRTIIGKHCSIGPGTIVGADAFDVDTTQQPNRIIAQSGGVALADYVDVQAKCTLVRATFGGFTRLGEGTKFDCQVHFAHDCTTGRNVRI